MVLLSRRTTGPDPVAVFVTFCWLFYIIINVTELWTRRTTGQILWWNWMVTTATLLYSITFVAMINLSISRTLAFMTFDQKKKKMLEICGNIFLGFVLLVRCLRTGFLYARTSLYYSGETEDDGSKNLNPTLVRLGYVTAAIQIGTILPCFLLRLGLDATSIHKLYMCRKKYIEAGGKEAFRIIEALNYSGSMKFSFVDWVLISWCLGSWVDQKALYLQIFGGGKIENPTSIADHSIVIQTAEVSMIPARRMSISSLGTSIYSPASFARATAEEQWVVEISAQTLNATVEEKTGSVEGTAPVMSGKKLEEGP
ncbi:hypothetical protein HDU67_004632 [Dinochytrium kinnereticum]|nr:hypothetical protein HDU67_004632 [Dinochytrium kinnereticum]